MKGVISIIYRIKRCFLNVKLWLMNCAVMTVFYINIMTCYGAEYVYKDVVYLHDYLILSDFWGVIKKGLGNWFFDMTSWILNGCYDAYESMSKFNILEDANIKSLLNNLDQLVYAVFFVIFVIAIICKLLKVENPIKVMGNAFACLTAVVLFSTLMSMGTNLKNATMKDIDSIVNAGDYEISDTIYAQNTVDVLKSLKAGEIVNLRAGDMPYFDTDEVVKKAYLIDRPRIDETSGEVVYEDLGDGFLGVGEVRYYRYNTDFWTVNCTVIASIIVYILAMLKHVFLLVDWFLINVFGKFALGRGFFGVDNIGKVGKSMANNLVAQIVLYSMMSLFSIYMSATMVNSEIHWIFKVLLIWGYGMTVFVGSSFITKGLGIEDNFGKVAGAMFATQKMGRSMNRHAKQLGHALSNAGESAGKVFDKIGEKSYDKISQDYQDKMDKAMQGDEFKDAMHEGKTEDDIQQAREKMQEQDYQKDINEQAKKELYGDDYKLQEQKDKLQQAKENEQLTEQAKKELYGDDYKLQEQKDKLVQGEEKAKLTDQAKKELYGDDYKLQEEKQKLVQADEHAQVTDQAKTELYGDDYKYQEVKQDVIDGEQRAEYVEQAKVELHGGDYKEKQMRSQIEDSLDRQEMKEQIVSERELAKAQQQGSKSAEPLGYEEVDVEQLSGLLDKLKNGGL